MIINNLHCVAFLSPSFLGGWETQESVCLGKHPFLLRGAGTAASCRAVITMAPPMREREVTGTSSFGHTTYEVIGRVGLTQTDSSCL